MVAGHIISLNDQILVTGSNGFIGTKVVEILMNRGFSNLRCFIRPSSRLGRLEDTVHRLDKVTDIQLVTGDLLSADDCRKAADGVSVIYHLATGSERSFAGAFVNSAVATRNLLQAFAEVGQPKRFVNVSSFAVYSPVNLQRGTTVDETCALEDSPQKRFDAYGFGKLKQEELVKEYGRKQGLPFVIVRPGYVFGPGQKGLGGRIGITAFGPFIQINGSNELPMTFVDNCAEAIVLAGLRPDIEGEVFNIVDDELLTAREFLARYRKKDPIRFVRIPYWLGHGACFLWEKFSEWSKGQLPPVFNRRRCAAEWRSYRYTNQKAKDRLGWVPRVSTNEAMEAFLSQFESASNHE